jgi:hypothetical protein
MTIHSAPLEAVHPQLAAARTVVVLLEAAAGAAYVDGSALTLHPCDCVTVTTRPATVTVPDRAGPSIAATCKTTTPGPLPVAPEATEIHGTELCALQLQPAVAETATCPGPPAAPTLRGSAPTL